MGVFSFMPVIIVGGLADTIGVKFVITGIGVIVLIVAFVKTFVLDRI